MGDSILNRMIKEMIIEKMSKALKEVRELATLISMEKSFPGKGDI